MRIIAGSYKGRKLLAPSDQSVRPTPDRVKEALFSMLVDDVVDGIVLDLFSGSGNLGLEALSRGAGRCYFCDNSRDSISLIKQNIAHCKAESLANVILGDYQTVLYKICEKLDVVLIDPPYRDNLWENAVSIIHENDLMNHGGIIVLEHPRSVSFPEEMYGFRKTKERRYGTVVLSIYMC